MDQKYLQFLQNELEQLKKQASYKEERIITSPQQATVKLKGDISLLNFCSNNYLGLANDPRIIESAKASFHKYGFGLASVRFICGTQDIHLALEKKLTEFLKQKRRFFIVPVLTLTAGFSRQF